MKILIEESILKKIYLHASKDTSKEVVGLLLGRIENSNLIITDSLTGPTIASKTSAHLSREFLAEITQKKIDGRLSAPIIGWYHSHPDYGCFMSERDVETQENIQSVFKNAVALVVDPVRGEEAFFRVSNGGFHKISHKVLAEEKVFEENNKEKKMEKKSKMKYVSAFLMILLLVSLSFNFYLYNEEKKLEKAYFELAVKYQYLHAQADRELIITDTFDSMLLDFGVYLEGTNYATLKKHYSNLLINYLKKFKQEKTSNLEVLFENEKFSQGIDASKTILDNSKTLFSSSANLLEVDTEFKEIGKIVMELDENNTKNRFCNLFYQYLTDIKEYNIQNLQKLGCSRFIEEALKLNNLTPLVLIASPQEGEVIRGVKKIEWKATDPDGEVVMIKIEYKKFYEDSWSSFGGEIIQTEESFYAYWDTTNVTDGEYVLRITAKDDVGGTYTRESGKFKVKNINSPPTLKILEPKKDEKYSGMLEIKWIATDEDNDILTVIIEYSQDGENWIKIAQTTNTGSYIWDISFLEDGVYTIRITVRDSRGGEVTVVSQSFIVDN